MTIHTKLNDGTGVKWKKVQQPFIRLGDGVNSAWYPGKRVLTKTAAGWKEVWPNIITYTFYGTGYNLNMATCFKQMLALANLEVGNYVFINKGSIGGYAGGGMNSISLDSGVFPNGSTLTFVNEGYVAGVGGDGSDFIDNKGVVRQPGAGGSALILRFPTLILNSGIIQSGGGGGGAFGDFDDDHRWNIFGGGGAGLPGGRSMLSGWYTTGLGGLTSPKRDGTLTDGGLGYVGKMNNITYDGTADGYGGDPGQAGKESWIIHSDKDKCKITMGGPAGPAIINAGYIQAGSTGIDASHVFGRQTPGQSNNPYVLLNAISGDGSFGTEVYVDLTLAGGTGSLVTAAAWESGGANIIVTKLSETRYSFKSSQTYYYTDFTDRYTTPQRYGMIKFTVTDGAGRTDTFSMYMRVGDSQALYVAPPPPTPTETVTASCFPAGSMITMADGSEKPIELIQVGDVVKTAVGTSEVYQIDLPILGQRPMYEFEDGRCKTSGEHSMWSREPGTEHEWWATRDMKQWEFEAENGFGPNFDPKPFDLSNMENTHWEFATLNGWVNTTWHRVETSPDTQLYHLLLIRGGSYYVDGYLVSSMADSGGVDWETYKHQL